MSMVEHVPFFILVQRQLIFLLSITYLQIIQQTEVEQFTPPVANLE